MMPVEVRVTATLQRIVGGKSVQTQGSTVGEVIEELDQRYPGFKSYLVTEEGQVHRFINIFLNDEDIRFLGNLATPLSEGDVLSILPAMAGGFGEVCEEG